jgi:hypothetical protein
MWDVGHLADTVPLRCEIESDEDKISPNRNPEPVTVDVQIVCETSTDRPLVVIR